MTHRRAKKLHDSIARQNIEEVRENIKETFTDKHVFNENNESAVAVSLKLKNFDIYEILIKNGFQLGSKENFGFIVEIFSDREKIKLRSIHFECFTDPAENYLLILMTKCKLIHTSSDEVRKNFFNRIDEVFKKLAAIEWIMLVLQIVTFSDGLKLIFDFDRDSADYIDPTLNKGTKGICYPKSENILIGAKGLLSEDPSKSRYVMGVIAHEISHCWGRFEGNTEGRLSQKGL